MAMGKKVCGGGMDIGGVHIISAAYGSICFVGVFLCKYVRLPEEFGIYEFLVFEGVCCLLGENVRCVGESNVCGCLMCGV